MQETVLEVEYFLAVTPPEQKEQLPHDDWYALSQQGVSLGASEGLLASKKA